MVIHHELTALPWLELNQYHHGDVSELFSRKKSAKIVMPWTQPVHAGGDRGRSLNFTKVYNIGLTRTTNFVAPRCVQVLDATHRS